MILRTVALDFETAYNGDYSVADMGTWAYCADPRFRMLQVAMHRDDGQAGAWADAASVPWEWLHGARVIAHNAAFDRAVFDRIQADGAAQGVVPACWGDTAALAAYHGLPRDLAGAVLQLFGVVLDKGVRDRIQHGDLFDDLAAYAASDAGWCWRIWERLGAKWPAHEQRLAALTVDMGRRGVPVDVPTVDHARVSMRQTVDDLAAGIPFSPPLSIPAFNGWCAARGVDAPKSTGKAASVEGLDGDTATMLRKVQQLRSANRTAALFDSLAVRTRPDGRMTYDLKYFGASQTGRWSGGGGFNMQNLNRAEAAGADVRAMFCCPEGRVFVIADYAQIEARVLLWLAGERAMLEMIDGGMDLYEAAARRMLGYTDPRPIKEVNPGLRQLAKGMQLGLGFGMGAGKFVSAATSLAGLEIGFDQAQEAVTTFRQQMRGVTGLWSRLADDFEAASGKPYHQMALPSGRLMTYWMPSCCGNMEAAQVKGGPRYQLHPGLLAENLVQATARDVLASAWLRCVDAGYCPVMSVHDELVFECDEADAPAVRDAVTEIMVEPRRWSQGLPVEVEAKISRRYGK